MNTDYVAIGGQPYVLYTFTSNDMIDSSIQYYMMHPYNFLEEGVMLDSSKINGRKSSFAYIL